VVFVDWAVEVNEWDSNEWFADDDIWLRQTWKLCSEIIKSVVLLKPNDNRYGRKMTNNEKMAGACEVVVKMARRMGDVSDGRVEAGKVITLGKEATEVDPTDDDDLEEFTELSNDIRVEVESAVYDNDQDEFDREAVAELIGVDADVVDDDVMKEACADHIREYHPGQSTLRRTLSPQRNSISSCRPRIVLARAGTFVTGYYLPKSP